MEQKVAVITGASSGIGKETVYELIGRGFKVYGGARRMECMEEIKKAGAYILTLDVTKEESRVAFINEILAQEGRIDVLINNAGYGSCGSIEDIPFEEVRNQFEVNVFGLGRMIQLVLPIMRKQGRGKIVNISSMGGRCTTPFGGWYHSTKYAVEALSEALRMETLPFGIDTILIEPGMIQTNWGVIAGKNIRTSSKGGAYEKRGEAVASFYEKCYGDEKHSLTEPKYIAKVIGKAITTKRPKMRYLVGKYAKLFIFLKGILSDKLFQKMEMLLIQVIQKQGTL